MKKDEYANMSLPELEDLLNKTEVELQNLEHTPVRLFVKGDVEKMSIMRNETIPNIKRKIEEIKSDWTLF